MRLNISMNRFTGADDFPYIFIAFVYIDIYAYFRYLIMQTMVEFIAARGMRSGNSKSHEFAICCKMGCRDDKGAKFRNDTS